jgi:hypothetical protein
MAEQRVSFSPRSQRAREEEMFRLGGGMDGMRVVARGEGQPRWFYTDAMDHELGLGTEMSRQ